MKRSFAIALASTAVIAGCGGPSADDYRADATAICETAAADLAALRPPDDSAAGVAAYSDVAADIRERETVELDELEPPDDLAESHTRLVNASAAIARSLRDLARAAERGDRDAANGAAANGARAADQAQRAAEALGLPRCGQPGEAA